MVPQHVPRGDDFDAVDGFRLVSHARLLSNEKAAPVEGGSWCADVMVGGQVLMRIVPPAFSASHNPASQERSTRSANDFRTNRPSSPTCSGPRYGSPETGWISGSG